MKNAHIKPLSDARAGFFYGLVASGFLWAIGYTTTEEIVETLRRVRKVETVYTKDFSELTGARATIITT